MKKNLILAGIFVVAVLLAPIHSARAQATNSPFVSVSKTSFAEVTAQLDPGGNFFLYLGTAQWLEHLSTKAETWRQKFISYPDAKPADVTNLNKAFDIVTRLIKDSGLEDISGLGLSSVEIAPGIYRNKALLHHYPGKGDGFLWKLAGEKPHALTGLDLLPENTALAIFSDADLPLLWSVIKDETEKSDFPQAQNFLQKLPAQFEKKTKVKWDTFINSLGGEFGFVITLDESNPVVLPLPPASMIQMPEPGLLLAIRVKDDTIFNRIDQQLKTNSQVISVDKAGLKMRTLPVALPLPINLRPTAASSGGYLFIASSDWLINEMLAVKAGERPGLKSTAEFKRLSQNIPEQGNQFSFMSEKFGETLFDIQRQMMNSSLARGQSAAQIQWTKSFFQNNRPTFSYSVGLNTDDGCLTIGNGNQSAAALVLLPAIAVPGMLAAIAIPNFVKARTTAQQNACINNLRMIDAAKMQWSLEKNKKDGDVPTQEDLLPYVGPKWPTCPAGGTYTIGAIGQKPTCSIPSHRLP
jgi:competence protein ComGC